ncbi:putative lipid II flippase FtsW [Candidatus Parcubacteria bacterium]|nr:putative lipid II flippase FtsW [Candidatus Parcubacteria bacterium]
MKKADTIFFAITAVLLIAGVFMFSSAALGVLAKSEAKFYGMLFSQVILGLAGGLAALFLFSRMDYRKWKKYAFYILLIAIIVNILVFVPGIGFEHNGAKRWLLLGNFSFQPSELLKIGWVIYFAAWLAWTKDKVRMFRYGILPFLILSGIAGGILLMEPDTGTFLVIFGTGIAMLLVAGARFRDLGLMGAVSIAAVAILAFMKPYLKARLLTFINPAMDPLGASYQLQQSLIAIGSGGLFGRGFGQSIQKFNFLPEPVGDSIFAVLSEEFGFIGGAVLILLFLAFALRGFKISQSANDQFGKLLGVGLVSLIVFQSYLNIASMLGVSPLVGVPIVFVSQGGTALLFGLLEVGILLSISRFSAR